MNEAQAIQQVRKIMKDNLYQRKTLTTSWSLEFNRLAMFNSTKRIFSKPSEQWGKAYHVEILVDNSWSMYNSDRAGAAFGAAQNICKTLKWAADVTVTSFNYEDINFNSKEFITKTYQDWRDLAHRELREQKIWDETHFCLSSIEWSKWDRFNAAWWNWEICTLVNAQHRLQNKEWNRIIIILLDGRINLDSHDERDLIQKNYFIAWLPMKKYNRDTYRETVKSMEKNWIKVLSYWIETDWPKQYFDNFKYIWDPNDIYKHLVDDLKKIIKK